MYIYVNDMSFTPPQRCVGYLVRKELFWPEFSVLSQLLVQVSKFLFTTTPARTEIVESDKQWNEA